MDGKPRYFANTVLSVLLIWPHEPFLTNVFLMRLTKCIHFMQLADLVVASKIVNGKYQHFYISFLVQVFNNREIANNSCVKGKSSTNECSSCITGNDISLRFRLGTSPRLQPDALQTGGLPHIKWARRNLRGIILHGYLAHIWHRVRESRLYLWVSEDQKDLQNWGI